MHTIRTLQRDLARARLKPHDTLLVHSSMKSIGEVDGGADAVLDALMAYFAPGLLAFPALTWSVADQQTPVFDVLHSESQVGLLPEMFRKRPNVWRSWHPTHSMAACGADAQAFTARDHLNHTPCGELSSWHQLIERDARILMIGCDLTTCTLLHGVEEWCGVPGRLAEPAQFTVVAPDGSRLKVSSSPHIGFPSEQYGRAEPALRGSGALTDARFGDARALVLSARKAYDTVRDLLHQNPGLFDEPA